MFGVVSCYKVIYLNIHIKYKHRYIRTLERALLLNKSLLRGMGVWVVVDGCGGIIKSIGTHGCVCLLELLLCFLLCIFC